MKIKTKTKRKLFKPFKSLRRQTKKLPRLLFRKRLKKRTQKKLLRGVFVLIMATCTGSLTIALAASQPKASLQTGGKVTPKSITLNPPATPPSPPADQIGTASWYALGLPSPDALTCASTRFGRGTYLQVTDRRNGRKVTCLVNDYGPASYTGRVIDLSRGSFRQLEGLGAGTIPVEVRLVKPVDQTAPQGLNLPIPTHIGDIIGYQLCQTKNSPAYCEAFRQETR